MAPKRNMKTPIRRQSKASGRALFRSATRGESLCRPLARTVTTLHHKHIASIATPASPRYLRLSGLTNEPQHDAISERDHHRSTQNSHQRAIPTDRRSSSELQLLLLGKNSTPEEVKRVHETIAEYCERWSGRDNFQAPASFFDDMRMINEALQGTSLPAAILAQPDVRDSCNRVRESYAKFVTLWSQATQSALWMKLSELQGQIRRRPDDLQESAFTSFLAEVQAISRCPPFLSGHVTGIEEIPVLLPTNNARDLIFQCEEVHGQFQDLTYHSEMRSLWLLIWRSLKSAFMVSEMGRMKELDDSGSIELIFFARPGVTPELRRLIQLPDAANPRSIEDIVGRYCRFIEKCRTGTADGAHFHLRRSRNQPLKSHVLSSLRRFTETRRLETNTLAKLHFAVVRLNALNGGPTICRRWKESEADGDWIVSPSHFLSPTESHAASTARRFSSQDEHIVEPEGTRRLTNVTNESMQSSFPHPQGINMRCHHDYVYCPFPETRAHEVAQSELISRDLAEPGIMSEGLRSEYLIDRPPPHTRDPAELSIFTSKKTKIGPLGWLGLTIQQFLPRRGRRTHTTSDFNLARRNPHGEEHSRKATRILDPNSRVKKTTAKIQALGLRGGAGGASPETPPAQNRTTKHVPNAFKRRHIEMFRRELNRNHGEVQEPNETQILNTLEIMGYDVINAVTQYRRPRSHVPVWQGPGPLNANNVKVDAVASGMNDTVNSAGAEAPSTADRHNRPQTGAVRQPLRELVTGPGSPPEDVDDDQHQHHGQVEVQAGHGSMSPNIFRESSSSNRENLNPDGNGVLAENHLDTRCHPCPWYKGHIHHNCQCGPNNIVWEPAPPEDDGLIESPTHNHVSEEHEQSPEPGTNQDENQYPQQAQDSQPARRRGLRSSPTLRVVHTQDGVLIRDLYAQGCEFHRVLRDIGVPIRELRGMVMGEDPRLLINTAGPELDAAVERLRVQTDLLRRAYLAPLHAATTVMLDQVRPDDRRHGGESPAKRLALVQQTWQEVEQQHSQVLGILNDRLDRTNFSLRLKLNRFIRLIRDLHCLVKEFTQPLSEGENSSDSQEFLSEDEQQRLANFNRQSQRRILPTQEAYERMLKDELEREIAIERQYEFPPGVKPNKATLIHNLMLLDRRGVLGAGAQHHYRILLDKPDAMRRPKRFNLDKAIEAYKKRQVEGRKAGRVAQRHGRQQRRRDKGLSPTRGLTILPAAQGPFTDSNDDLSADEEKNLSESESTESER
ncbi:hypothetical protein PV11_09788 [Exophiala sideris]|uniref:Uncharacterized protein n=1 Tax=Exophiala sideris TaxID=1016849 RepID=A0A0D1YT31_9EURO|nr:hypothetical protein PV11_09788 [Exophiala sideris]